MDINVLDTEPDTVPTTVLKPNIKVLDTNGEFWSGQIWICPICLTYSTKLMNQTLNHLLQSHQIKILNINSIIPFLDTYLNSCLNDLKLENSNQMIELGSSNDKQDLDTRYNLQKQKLIEILAIQENERNSNHQIHCLFCRFITDNHTNLFKHLFDEHGLLIGLLDNLVFVDEFLMILKQKLQQLLCLYCEKTFTSNAVLRKHMRKKKHFQVNPKNSDYDKFYLVNYYQDVTVTTNTIDPNDEDTGDAQWEDWQDLVESRTMCLFDDTLHETPELCNEHMKSIHHFDLFELKLDDQLLDFYQRIRLINYIRSKYSKCICFQCDQSFQHQDLLVEHLNTHQQLCPSKNHSLWHDPSFLFPFFENDPLLMLDMDDDEM
ncbi:hypothetical protein BC833DRAFT_591374 [Globomyces pollinis-pini]|nr:hypothetical protein BC833DRAFT_591374 [Globomyces pollinis-pini]